MDGVVGLGSRLSGPKRRAAGCGGTQPQNGSCWHLGQAVHLGTLWPSEENDFLWRQDMSRCQD